jgi:hypothetical protein
MLTAMESSCITILALPIRGALLPCGRRTSLHAADSHVALDVRCGGGHDDDCEDADGYACDSKYHYYYSLVVS